MHSFGLLSAFFCIIHLSLSAELPIAWGEPVSGVSVGLIFSNSEFRATEPIEATVIVRNDSDEVLFLPTFPPTWYFDITAVSEGKALPRLPTVGSTTGARVRVMPGGMKAFSLNLQEFVAIVEPTELAITAKRFFRNKDGDQSALSGNTSIRITAKASNDSGSNELVSLQELSSIAASFPTAPRVKRSAAVESPLTNPSSHNRAIAPAPNATTHSVAQVSPSSSSKRLGVALVGGLLTVVLAILWRAARRKPEG